MATQINNFTFNAGKTRVSLTVKKVDLRKTEVEKINDMLRKVHANGYIVSNGSRWCWVTTGKLDRVTKQRARTMQPLKVGIRFSCAIEGK